MRTLIIPDIHTKFLKAEALIVSVPHDRVVFLGDYFDDWGDGPHHARQTAEWLVESTQKPERVHLIGNHDTHYMCPTVCGYLGLDGETQYNFVEKYMNITCCSGFDRRKAVAIYGVPGIHEAFRNLRTAYFQDNIVMTHAGLHRMFGNAFLDSVENLFWSGLELFKRGVRTNETFFKSFVLEFGAGKSRGGSVDVPGPVWFDFEADKIHMSPDICQLVGHTSGKRVRDVRHANGNWAVCIDTAFKHYAVLDNGELAVYDTVDNALVEVYKSGNAA